MSSLHVVPANPKPPPQHRRLPRPTRRRHIASPLPSTARAHEPIRGPPGSIAAIARPRARARTRNLAARPQLLPSAANSASGDRTSPEMSAPPPCPSSPSSLRSFFSPSPSSSSPAGAHAMAVPPSPQPDPASTSTAVDHRGWIRGPHAQIHPFPAFPMPTGVPHPLAAGVDFRHGCSVRGMDLPRPGSHFCAG
nr:lysine-rich arabinogalactan protein 19-like [Aegilops tauschii subsp. strangulata]